MQHIVICSQDTRFSNALAEIIAAQLQVEVIQLENTKQLEKLSAADVNLVIATAPVEAFWQGHSLLYLTGKPQKIHAVLADIRTQLAQKPLEEHILHDTIMLNVTNRSLQHRDTGEIIELTEKERTLLLFMKENGEASRKDILSAVWGFAQGVDTHTFETHLYRLRQKWRGLADFDCIIATDKGYRWYE